MEHNSKPKSNNRRRNKTNTRKKSSSAGNRRKKRRVAESNDTSQKINTAVIGIAGAPSSGMTSLVHVLSEVLSEDRQVIRLHLEDFAVPPYHIVAYEDGTLDGDCKGAFNLTSFRRVLRYTKKHGSLPSSFESILPAESDKARAMSRINTQNVKDARLIISKAFPNNSLQQPILLVEGGLLFLSERILKMLDVKLFLRTTKQGSLARRFEQPEFQNPGPDQWWKTKEYFETVAWPNYLAHYRRLFSGGNVERGTESAKCQRLGIDIQKTPDAVAGDVLVWAVETISKGLAPLDAAPRLKSVKSKRDGGMERRSEKHGALKKAVMACLESLKELFLVKR